MNKKVLITGSSRGIGFVTAKILAEAGCDVFITGKNPLFLEEQTSKIKAKGFLAGDLEQEDFPEKLIESALFSLGKIDVLVNNAGIYLWSPVEKINFKEIEMFFRVNLLAPVKLCKLAVPEMKKSGWGRIINIGSISGSVGEPGACVYSTSKAGLIGLTKSLALELAEYGITVNIINPGWVKTDMAQNALTAANLSEEEEISVVPLKRWIDPLEVSELVKYLISDSASGITGQSINLCCGLSLG
jgi:NAD(P)-dependent dehydrogenase (short-subunit alcohol dehydrogenase family)